MNKNPDKYFNGMACESAFVKFQRRLLTVNRDDIVDTKPVKELIMIDDSLEKKARIKFAQKKEEIEKLKQEIFSGNGKKDKPYLDIGLVTNVFESAKTVHYIGKSGKTKYEKMVAEFVTGKKLGKEIRPGDFCVMTSKDEEVDSFLTIKMGPPRLDKVIKIANGDE